MSHIIVIPALAASLGLASAQTQELERFDTSFDGNEASGLLEVENFKFMEEMDWTAAFWVVCGQGKVDDSIALVAETESGERVLVEPEIQVRDSSPETADSQALARFGNWVYVFGSHAGPVQEPLSLEHHFAARFDESDIRLDNGTPAIEMEIGHRRFILHDALNEALRESRFDLIPRGAGEADVLERTAEQYPAAVDAGHLSSAMDRRLRIEGAAFLDDGSAVLGLRYPVTAGGDPIIAVVHHVEGFFTDPPITPQVERVVTLDIARSEEVPTGIRALDSAGGDVFHALVGNLTDEPRSSILGDHPTARDASVRHVEFQIPPDDRQSSRPQTIREFEDGQRVDGLAWSPVDKSYYAVGTSESLRLLCPPKP